MVSLVFFSTLTFVDFIETLGECFESEDLAVNLRKVDPNKSCSLDQFDFVRWYVDENGFSGLRRGGSNFGRLWL